MVSFPPISPPRFYRPPSPHPYAPHAQPISFFSILSPAQCWVRSTDHLAPRYAISCIPRYLVPPRSKYSPQHHIFKHPQLPFLLQCQRPRFTPIHNNRHNYSSRNLHTKKFYVASNVRVRINETFEFHCTQLLISGIFCKIQCKSCVPLCSLIPALWATVRVVQDCTPCISFCVG